MDSGGGRCYDNARCESVIVIMKEEMFYSHKENLKIIQFIRQYFLSYNDERIGEKTNIYKFLKLC